MKTRRGRHKRYVNRNGQITEVQSSSIYNFLLTCRSGSGCSKLTRSLVNVSLKFQMLISQICQHFLLKKYEKLLSFFSTKNICVFGNKVVKDLKS